VVRWFPLRASTVANVAAKGEVGSEMIETLGTLFFKPESYKIEFLKKKMVNNDI